MAAEHGYLQIIHIIAEIISYFTRTWEFFIVIFLTIKLLKCDHHFKDAYYIILNIGYIFDLIKFANQLYVSYDGAYLMRMVIHGWYSTYFLTLWNVILCCNRCTALTFPKFHPKIWSPLKISLILIFLIAFPFLIDGYVLFTFQCTDDEYSECLNFRKVYYFKGVIFNSSFTAIMILFIAFSMYKSSSTTKKNNDLFDERNESTKTTKQEKVEQKKLIYQALISSIFQLFYFILNYFSATTENEEKRLILIYSSDIVYHLQHIGVMIIHFICSPTFKLEFFKFYFLTYLFNFFIKGKRNVKVLDSSQHLDIVQTF